MLHGTRKSVINKHSFGPTRVSVDENEYISDSRNVCKIHMDPVPGLRLRRPDDFAFLLMSIFYIVYRSVVTMFPELSVGVDHVIQVYHVVWYVGHVARTGRNWIIVAVAIDRYVVIRNPFSAAVQSTYARAKVSSIVITLAAFAYNLPRVWEWRVTEHVDIDPVDCAEQRIRIISATDLGRHFSLIYVSVMYCVFIAVGPLLLLTVFNSLLALTLVRANQMRATLSSSSFHQRSDTRMLIAVICVFLVTEFPGAVFQVMITTESTHVVGFWTYFQYLVDLGTVINSAANFVIYYLCGKRFRRNLGLVVGNSVRKFSVRMHNMRRRSTMTTANGDADYTTVDAFGIETAAQRRNKMIELKPSALEQHAKLLQHHIDSSEQNST